MIWVGKRVIIYPSQTKILEDPTNISEQVFEALFKVVSTRFWLQNVEKCFENAFWNVCSVVQNLRLGSIKFQNLRLGSIECTLEMVGGYSSVLDGLWLTRLASTPLKHDGCDVRLRTQSSCYLLSWYCNRRIVMLTVSQWKCHCLSNTSSFYHHLAMSNASEWHINMPSCPFNTTASFYEHNPHATILILQ
jgi:hypothetical protein